MTVAKFMIIRNIESKDYSQISEIYRQGIDTGIATFQTEITDWETWDKSHLSNCRIAVFEVGKITKIEIMAGWAALTPVSGRCVYAGVAEVSIYISVDFRKMGIGELLLKRLIQESEKDGLWTLQSGIFVENIGSIRLHEKCGFRKVGFREKIGQKEGVWKDNIIMERRSTIIGV
jgi:L-amino acid N-acyltransferase YncA